MWCVDLEATCNLFPVNLIGLNFVSNDEMPQCIVEKEKKNIINKWAQINLIEWKFSSVYDPNSLHRSFVHLFVHSACQCEPKHTYIYYNISTFVMFTKAYTLKTSQYKHQKTAEKKRKSKMNKHHHKKESNSRNSSFWMIGWLNFLIPFATK